MQICDSVICRTTIQVSSLRADPGPATIHAVAGGGGVVSSGGGGGGPVKAGVERR